MSPTLFFSTAFTLGLLGSLHCLGMCGPIAVALPGGGPRQSTYAVGRLLYNLGRVLTYTLLGLVAGLVGKTVALAGLQRWVSIGVGLLLLAAALFGRRVTSGGPLAGWAGRAVGRLKTALGALMRGHGLGALFGIGLLNGLLPCGLVYVALAAAVAAGGFWVGGLYMACFGLGTIPLMLAVSLFGHTVLVRWRRPLQRLLPVGLAVLSALFILRGLSLGIPYLSPDLSTAAAAGSCCPPAP